jgi:hypothetical protein
MQQLKFCSLFAFTIAVRIQSRNVLTNLAEEKAHSRSGAYLQQPVCPAVLCPIPNFDGDCPEFVCPGDENIDCLCNACLGPDFKLVDDFNVAPYSYLANLCTDGCDSNTGLGAFADLGCRCFNEGCEIPPD